MTPTNDTWKHLTQQQRNLLWDLAVMGTRKQVIGGACRPLAKLVFLKLATSEPASVGRWARITELGLKVASG